MRINKKDNTKGLGQKKHFTSDQWWMNAFDEQLKGLDTSKEGQVVQTVTTGKLNTIDHTRQGWFSLYAGFVKGGLLEGTVRKTKDPSETDTVDTESGSDTSSEDKVDATPVPTAKVETKEERRARREEKRLRREKKSLRREAREKEKEKEKRKISSRKVEKETKSTGGDEDLVDKIEKRRRKEKKDRKLHKEDKVKRSTAEDDLDKVEKRRLRAKKEEKERRARKEEKRRKRKEA